MTEFWASCLMQLQIQLMPTIVGNWQFGTILGDFRAQEVRYFIQSDFYRCVVCTRFGDTHGTREEKEREALKDIPSLAAFAHAFFF